VITQVDTYGKYRGFPAKLRVFGLGAGEGWRWAIYLIPDKHEEFAAVNCYQTYSSHQSASFDGKKQLDQDSLVWDEHIEEAPADPKPETDQEKKARLARMIVELKLKEFATRKEIDEADKELRKVTTKGVYVKHNNGLYRVDSEGVSFIACPEDVID
jgi:hypothetical protein